MDRILGIDYGKKRTGLAVSDPLGIFASALETVPTANIINYLKKYTSQNKVERFVVGYPMNLNGSPAECTPFVEAFVKVLKKNFPSIPITLEDERFTSQLAMRAMIDGGMKRSERRIKGSVDRISAAIILQSWLDGQNNAAQPICGNADDLAQQ
ncbi:MAG: Holliday junction resolvase RuvX [Candidatus Egerieousia sp.]|nr:Holliday junction resolvase RuvX [bacterium]MDY5319440.1 Holliday junction resolvase RuvX [Candidatus Egerieousia sp.]